MAQIEITVSGRIPKYFFGALNEKYREEVKQVQYCNDEEIETDWNTIFEILKKDCSKYLQELKSSQSIIFRGVRGSKELVSKGVWLKQSDKSRNPVGKHHLHNNIHHK
jgi:hypothetical protein